MRVLNPVNKSYCLHKVCESNFHKLLRLAPDLIQIDQTVVAQVNGNPALHLRVLERNRYTLTMELTHYFSHDVRVLFEPAVRIRVYLDAQSAEVLVDQKLRETPYTQNRKPDPRAILDFKWSINYFLEKWLNHCLNTGYCFEIATATEPGAV